MPLRSIRDEPQPPPRPKANPAPPPQRLRRRRFQFSLYILILMTTVIGLALAPASYLMRTGDDNHSGRMWNLLFLLAWPMILVIFINVAYKLFQLIRRR